MESCGQQRREAANTGPGTRRREAEASSGRLARVTEGGGGELRRVCVVETKRERVSGRRDLCANAVVKKRTEMSEQMQH